jgi:hypothetical protein
VIRARELISAIHPAGSRRKATVVLKAYFDDSGSHDQAKITSMGGFIGDVDMWEQFDDHWKPLLVAPDQAPLSEFKMYDCVHGFNEFSAPLWGFADRLRLAGKMVDVIVDTETLAIGSSVIRAHFDPLLASDWFRHKVPRSYYLCFEYCIQAAVNWTRRYNVAFGRDERVALVFDEQTEFAPLAHELYDEYKKSDKYGDRLISISFVSSKDLCPLQAADLLAYGTYDLSMRRYYPEMTRSDFPVGPVFDRMMNEGVAKAGGIYDEESLHRLVLRMIEADTDLLEKERQKANILWPK